MKSQINNINKRKNIYIKQKKRENIVLKLLFFVICFMFFLVIRKLTIESLIVGPENKEKAYNQQMVRKIISPKRGNILDRNGEILAQSLEVDTVSINPKRIKGKKGVVVDKNALAKKMAEIFDLPEEEVLEKVNSDANVETIAKKVSNDKIEKLKKYTEEAGITAGINIDKDNKRIYPYDRLAAQVIGFCGTDNIGLEGLERQYDDVLKGKTGLVRSLANVRGEALREAPAQAIKEEDGKNVYLTLDVQIQGVVEKHLQQVVKETAADSAIGIVMNPNNGEVLAMGNYPTYDLNNPYAPVGLNKKTWDKLSRQEKNNRLYDIWKNKAITNGYEPGSTFKIITGAIGMEENLTDSDRKGDFHCTTVQKVADREINCWSKIPHGAISLRQATMQSCNPAFIQLGNRIGRDLFLKYIKAFGLFDRTGIELPGEAVGQFHARDQIQATELATLSFGQRFNITPLQLVTAVSATVNGGKIIKPTIISKTENPETGAFDINEPKEIRTVVSEETSEKMRKILKDSVEKGTGKRAKVEGYSIGGKTGTSEPPPGNEKVGYVASFIGTVPAEKPEIVVLVLIKNPKKISREGSTIAAPIVGQIIKEVLPGIESNNKIANNKTVDKKDSKEDIVVNDVTGKTVVEAKRVLQNSRLGIEAKGVSNESEVKVVSQMPKPGTKLEKDSIIYITTTEHREKNKAKIPDLKGKSLDEAKTILKRNNLNYNIEGSKGLVEIQDPPPSTEVEKGFVVKITLKEEVTGR